jgi:hypothetical protein
VKKIVPAISLGLLSRREGGDPPLCLAVNFGERQMSALGTSFSSMGFEPIHNVLTLLKFAEL